jgi:hypothetical protein
MSKAFSPERRAAISAANRARVVTQETRRRMSISMRGNHNAMGCVRSDSTKLKLSLARVGKKHTLESRMKISMSTAGKNHPNYGKTTPPDVKAKISMSKMGEKNGRWLGGISFEPYCPKWNKDLRRRIRAYFNYQCVACGKDQLEESRQLSCHHVEYNKKACCDGKPVHFAALCYRCHAKTNSDRERWENMLHRIIDEMWEGRSYFTKEEWIMKTLSGED